MTVLLRSLVLSICRKLLEDRIIWIQNRGSQQQLPRKEIKNYGDPDVKWEVSEQWNLGLETRFFKDILEVNLDLYQEIRHNIIEQRVTIPAQVGVEVNPLDNLGKIRARGLDLSAKCNTLSVMTFGLF